MSRNSAATSTQLTANLSRHIYVTPVTINGEKKQVITSKPLTNQSIRLNVNAKQDGYDTSLDPTTGKIIYTKRSAQTQTLSGAWFLMSTLFSHDNIWCRGTTPADGVQEHITWMVPDVWKVIIQFTFGIFQHDQVEELGYYAIAINRPSIFAQIEMSLDQVTTGAVVRADEGKARYILNGNLLYLLRKLDLNKNPGVLLAHNSVGAPFTGLLAAARNQIQLTPFQAALACGDDDMCKMMAEQFARLTTDLEGNPIDGIAEMKQQYTNMIIKSLQHYLNKNELRIIQLITLRSELQKTDPNYTTTYKKIGEQIQTAQKNVRAYTKAFIASRSKTDENKSIDIIEKAHSQAQIDNKFDAKPYFEAIESATPTEIDALHRILTATTQQELDDAILATGTEFTQTDACRNKPFDQLNLFEKMNRYREELWLHMQDEIMLNPNHIQHALDLDYEKYWAIQDAGTDINFKKRDIIWVMGVGAPQRFASETYRQDIRQGTYYLVEKKEPRTRQFCFNACDRHGMCTRPVLADVSLTDSSLVDGWGFKFALSSPAVRPTLPPLDGSGADRRAAARLHCFSKLMSSKNITLGKLTHAPQRAQSCIPAREHSRCSMM
ncbi:MAG: hypothetical protein A3C44_05620 [Gammaproteobacteria bacterium RIFCSPHIGHO2_02_FULL_39_13]|nr:MAG: hypothetical protein A3C44_05620 [Gammaproteobacteria bacterium RIFCSPHIGHO2_02_FULL_39_13]OGT48225.1 MAG: hypothetical protein A3E53_01240 [Gammaproteobacteria bacterium RIFCSPHIGHO2_12_FULL_39_24]